MVPPNEIFGAIPNWLAVYLVSGISFAFAGFMLYQKVLRIVLLGRPKSRFDRPVKRILGVITIVLGQSRVLQRLSLRDKSGIGHFLIFWGFISFFASYLIFIFGDSVWKDFSKTIFSTTGVQIISFYLDIMAAVVLISLIWGVFRRWVVQPHRLSFDLTRHPDALVIVGAIGSLMLFTLLTEAFYIVSGGTGPETVVFVGGLFAKLMTSVGLSQETASFLQVVTWWLHLLIILGFGVYIPSSKHMHMIAAPVNILFRNLEARGTLSAMEDMETTESFGAGNIKGFTWKELLDGFACAVCGRCTDNCPANLTGKILSPMHIAEGIKDHLQEEGPGILANKGNGKGQEAPLFQKMLSEQAVWDCVTCGACMEECPVMVEHVDSIVDMRRNLVMEQSRMPETAQAVLVNLEQRGHPWRGTQVTRTDWMEGKDIKPLSDDPDVEVLLWVGCTPALNEANQRVPIAMASLLKVAGVKFGVLGAEEVCSGDPARRIGNEYLFQIQAQQNIETFNKYSVKKILTLCPHCFNTIKNEYPQLGGNYEVMHYTEFVDELIQDGRIKPIKSVDMVMTYHDSCYLGRHNNIYDSPRRIAKAIPGLKLLEMDRNRKQGFCCGAGGGHMWIEESTGKRINHARTEQFLATEGNTLGVSCPFCLQMFEEGIGSLGVQEKKQTKDLLEVLADSVIGVEGDLTPKNP
jgi:Fe-S oxidoreductase